MVTTSNYHPPQSALAACRLPLPAIINKGDTAAWHECRSSPTCPTVPSLGAEGSLAREPLPLTLSSCTQFPSLCSDPHSAKERSSDTMKNAIQRAVPVAPRYQINLLQFRIYQFHLERKKDVTVVWTDLSLKTPADSFTLAVLEKS